MNSVLSIVQNTAIRAALRVDDLVSSQDENVALSASKYALDRLLGKPTQRQEVDMSADLSVESESLSAAVALFSERSSGFSSKDD